MILFFLNYENAHNFYRVAHVNKKDIYTVRDTWFRPSGVFGCSLEVNKQKMLKNIS